MALSLALIQTAIADVLDGTLSSTREIAAGTYQVGSPDRAAAHALSLTLPTYEINAMAMERSGAAPMSTGAAHSIEVVNLDVEFTYPLPSVVQQRDRMAIQATMFQDANLAIQALTYQGNLTATVAEQQAYAKATPNVAGAAFGVSSAIDGDTAVIGAIDETGGGAAYVFVRNGEAWTFQQRLTGSNTEADDWFGYAVSISGETLVVTAMTESGSGTGIDPADNNSATEAGAAYVFTRTAGVWTQQAYIKASNTGASDWFGASVSLSGDTLVVGADTEDGSGTGINPSDNNSATSAGAVYAFTRTGSTWTQQAYIKASNAAAGDRFGYAVSVDDDTLAVGAYGEDSNATGIGGDQTNNSATSAGAVYVFTRSGTTWSQQAYVKASNTGASDLFGSSVSVSGDTLAVGATDEASNATGIGGDQTNNSAAIAGAVYVFTRTGTTWTQQAYVKASNTAAGDTFGFVISLDGDTLAVGAYLEDSVATGIDGDQADNTAADAGAVYVFTRIGSTWSQQSYLKGSNTGAGDGFGTSVAVSGDTVAIGAQTEDGSGTGIDPTSDNTSADAGAAYFVRVAQPTNIISGMLVGPGGMGYPSVDYDRDWATQIGTTTIHASAVVYVTQPT